MLRVGHGRLDNLIYLRPAMHFLSVLFAVLSGLSLADMAVAEPTLLIPAPEPSNATPARPLGSPADWATDNDYPTRALQLNEEGTAQFILIIDETGMPTQCRITSTTTFESLDKTTCDVMMQRARFIPARDSAGKPIASIWSSSVLWRVPSP